VAKKQTTNNQSTSIHANTPDVSMRRLVGRRQAALYLGLSVPSLDALRLQGEVRTVPVPATHRPGELLRTPLFDLRDLDALIDQWKEQR
jgi:hypothetical protein